MSSQELFRSSAGLSVYQHLLMLYQSDDRDPNIDSLNALPASFRQQIFCSVRDQSGRPAELNDGEVDVFQSFPKLQRAVQSVAVGAFRSLNQNTGNIGEEVTAADDPITLLQTMHSSFGDLTPELQQTLNTWVSEEEPGEQRAEASNRIIAFLKDPNQYCLILDNLGLKNLPAIWNHPAFRLRLLTLELFENRLSSLPSEIGQLSSLRALRIDKNELSSLPPEIGQLSSLTSLSLHNNPNLQGLPNEFFSLPHCITVDLSRTGLSEEQLVNLHEIITTSGYQGPWISFSISMERIDEDRDSMIDSTSSEDMESIEDMEDSPSGELESLSSLLAQLFSVLEEDPRSFPHLEQLDESQNGLIRSWLSRLSDTATYQRQGAFEKAFVKKVLDYLEAAENDEEFREVFLNTIFDATRTCGDRISLSILHIGIAFYLSEIKGEDLQQLYQFLIGTVWPVQMLEEIARKKIETLLLFDKIESDRIDQIETFLVYPIMLRDRLGLEIDVEGMLYPHCSRVGQEDLDRAAEYVEKQQQNEEAVCAFLSQREDWREALRSLYPERCEEIDNENYQELEAAGEDREKIDQLERNQQQRWKTLTASALFSAAKEE